MSIKRLIMDSAIMAGGSLMAKACHSAWGQAVVFTSAQHIVSMIFSRVAQERIKNGPQFAARQIINASASYLAGILVTHLVYQYPISWSAALSSLLASRFIVSIAACASLNEKQIADLRAIWSA